MVVGSMGEAKEMVVVMTAMDCTEMAKEDIPAMVEKD